VRTHTQTLAQSQLEAKLDDLFLQQKAVSKKIKCKQGDIFCTCETGKGVFLSFNRRR